MAPTITISKNNKTIADDTEFTTGDSLTVTISKTEDDGASIIEVFDHERNRRFYSRRVHEHIFSTMMPSTSAFGEWKIEVLVRNTRGDDTSQQFPLRFTASSDKVEDTKQIAEESDTAIEEEIIAQEEEGVETSEDEEIPEDRTENNVLLGVEDQSELRETGVEKIGETEPDEAIGEEKRNEIQLPDVEPEKDMTLEPTEVAFEEVTKEETPPKTDEEEDQQSDQPKEVTFEEYTYGGKTEPRKLEPEEIEYETIPDLHDQDEKETGEDNEIKDGESEYDLNKIGEEDNNETVSSMIDIEKEDVEDGEKEEMRAEKSYIQASAIISLNKLTFVEQQAALDAIETPQELAMVEPVVLTEAQKNDLEIPLAELDEIETKYYNNLKASDILYISHLLEKKPTDILAVSEADVVDVIIWLQRGLFIYSNPEHGLRSEYRKIRAEYLDYQRQLETLMESKLAQDPLSELISVNKKSITRLNEEGIETVGQLLQHQLIDLMNLDIDPEKPLLPKLWIANAKSYLAIK